MATKKKNKKSTKSKDSLESFVNRDFSNEPFILRKVEQAKKMIEKYGFPEELLDKKK